MEKKLRHKYVSVRYGSLVSYGGNQRQASGKLLRRCGCGVVAAADLLVYLSAHETDLPPLLERSENIPASEYNALLKELQTHYLPLIPHFGLSGWLMALGLNRFFLRKHWPVRAFWGVRSGRLQRCIAQMLSRDMPVILAVGPNLPLFWRRKSLTLYKKTPAGNYRPAGGTCAHYVTITAADDQWLRVSSWGQAYYIRWQDFQHYVQQYSNYFASNILYLRPKRFFF